MGNRKTGSLTAVFYILLLLGAVGFFGHGMVKGFENATLAKMASLEICINDSACCGHPLQPTCSNKLANEIERQRAMLP
jgi:hypothetical protein